MHHVADSHMNAFVRMRLGATEDNPPAKAYDEKIWARAGRLAHGAGRISLALLDGLHQRWTLWLGSLPAGTFDRTVMHSEKGS